MDKSTVREQENNKNSKKEPQTSISTNSPLSTQPLDNNPSPNDDDSITTSTESSDTFETWTLVMDKQKNDAVDRVEILKGSEDEDEQEDVEEPEEEEEEIAAIDDHKELQESLQDVTTDDLSDGISIISESESNGRISPHPYLRDHLQDLNLKFATARHDDSDILFNLRDDTAVQPPLPAPVIVSAEQQIRKRRRSSSTEQQQNNDKALQADSQSLAELNNIPPIVKRGLQAFFYIGVALGILALIGRMRNPTWGNSDPPSTELEQKINDMELQNNLMRAEIDLLNKQVKYLNTINDPQQQYQKKSGKYKGQYEDNFVAKGGKTFKAWMGNGDSLRPVEITKDDLKRPHKCPDGSFREFAGMCVENRRNDPDIVEQFEQIVDDFKQQSETIQTFEKVAQELHGLTENPFEQVKQILSEEGNPQDPDGKMRKRFNDQPNEFIKNNPIYKNEDPQQQQQQTDNKQDQHLHTRSKEEGEYHYQQRPPPSSSPYESKTSGKYKERYDNEKKFGTKPFDKDYKKSYDKDFNKDYNKKSLDNQSKETFDKIKYQKHKHRDDDDDDSDDNSREDLNKIKKDSKERYQKRDDNSKERYQKRDDNSKERYQKRDDNSKERPHRHDNDDSHERNGGKRSSSKERFHKQKQPNDSGEWHEHYMKHREDKRKENEQKYNGDNKNWYIKRGDDREHKRNGDIRYR